MNSLKQLVIGLMVVSAYAACDTPSLTNSVASIDSQSAKEYGETMAARVAQFDPSDQAQARRGLIAKFPADHALSIASSGYDFVTGPAPASVNPSLWRQEKLNNVQGLFRVTDDVYQIRAVDLANITLIKGTTGWIVVDPLTTRETATAAMAFAFEHLPSAPIVAVLMTHSHIDHFGGVLAIVEHALATTDLAIVAPEGFLEEAASENIVVGGAMQRRAAYMYGRDLPKSSIGHVGSGLGKEPVIGLVGLIPPTITITSTGERQTIDGVDFVFQIASGSEAPAEFTFYLPQSKVYCGAELVSRTMHNLYTLRGAKARDAIAWSDFIAESAVLFGEAEIYIGSHHWPIWGNVEVLAFLDRQSGMYKYIHDQTVRWINQGYDADEIADRIPYPKSLLRYADTQGYYGTLRHNAKAVYQRYMGWYTGHPSDLNPLPERQQGARMMEYMGGIDAVVAKAKTTLAGSASHADYRWLATVLRHAVDSDPNHREATGLLVQVFQYLGYRAESGPWRDVYLMAAQELQSGIHEGNVPLDQTFEMLKYAPVEVYLRAMGTSLKAEEADDKTYRLQINFIDTQQSYWVELRDNVIRHRHIADVSNLPAGMTADGILTIERETFVKLLIKIAGPTDVIGSGGTKFEGSVIDLARFLLLFDRPDFNFPIVTSR